MDDQLSEVGSMSFPTTYNHSSSNDKPVSDGDSLNSRDSFRPGVHSLRELKHGTDAVAFKLISQKNWNIVSSEPESETSFFVNGHSAMSVISVIGPMGVGKSTLLNRIAMKEAFLTHNPPPFEPKFDTRHVTCGIDIHSTHHRILLDCQPMLTTTIMEDLFSSHLNCQPSRDTAEFLVDCHMISLQLATFLIATCDFVVIMIDWLIDVDLLKLVASAIMIIGEGSPCAKLIIFSHDPQVLEDNFKTMINSYMGESRIEKFFSTERELIDFIGPYSREKCKLYRQDPSIFTGRNWLISCQRVWNSTIKRSPMFSDCAAKINHPSSVKT